MKKYLLLTVGCIALLMGCARLENTIARDGGLLGSYKSDYIIISKNGGLITDVWKIKYTMVQSEDGSDGWLWQDENGNAINVSGDLKVIRLNSRNSDLWDKYVEYHTEFDNCTYMEKFRNERVINPVEAR